MRKTIIVFLTLMLSLFLIGCSISPDMMLADYNGKLYEDVGGGIYMTDGKPNVNINLLSKDTYRVLASSYLRLEEGKEFLKHKWTLIDNKTGKEYVLSYDSIVYIGKPEIELEKGEYTIQLLVKNGNGVLFVDTATLLVV